MRNRTYENCTLWEIELMRSETYEKWNDKKRIMKHEFMRTEIMTNVTEPGKVLLIFRACLRIKSAENIRSKGYSL